MTDGLQDNWRRMILAELDRTPGIRRALLYGSRATGHYTRGSDVDLALEPEGSGPIPDQVKSSLWNRLDELDVPVEVSLVDLSVVPEGTFRAAILRDGRVFWEATATARG